MPRAKKAGAKKPAKKPRTTRPRPPREMVVHSCGGMPTRVGVSLQVIQTCLLRPDPARAFGAPSDTPGEKAALSAAWGVVTRYLLGEHDYEAPSWLVRRQMMPHGPPPGPEADGPPHDHGPPPHGHPAEV